MIFFDLSMDNDYFYKPFSISVTSSILIHLDFGLIERQQEQQKFHL